LLLGFVVVFLVASAGIYWVLTSRHAQTQPDLNGLSDMRIHFNHVAADSSRISQDLTAAGSEVSGVVRMLDSDLQPLARKRLERVQTLLREARENQAEMLTELGAISEQLAADRKEQ
jgi:hypothetical protein